MWDSTRFIFSGRKVEYEAAAVVQDRMFETKYLGSKFFSSFIPLVWIVFLVHNCEKFTIVVGEMCRSSDSGVNGGSLERSLVRSLVIIAQLLTIIQASVHHWIPSLSSLGSTWNLKYISKLLSRDSILEGVYFFKRNWVIRITNRKCCKVFR